jgi:excisionase family DNA binding protein
MFQLLHLLHSLQLLQLSDIIVLEAHMNTFRITKEDKIRSARALKKELPNLKESMPGNVLKLITTLIDDTTHDTDVVLDSPTVGEYVSPNQAATILQASRPYVRKLIDDQVLHAHKIGSHYKIKLSDVMALKDSWEPKQKESVEKLNTTLNKVINDTGWND